MAVTHQANMGKEPAQSDDGQGLMTDDPGLFSIEFPGAQGLFPARAGVPSAALLQQQEQFRNPGLPRIQFEVAVLATQNAQLVGENAALTRRLRITENALQHSKIETAGLYAQFGKLAEEWANTVRELKDLHEQNRNELERINEQLRKENNEMKKVIGDLKEMLDESEKEKRKLKVGQIGFHLELLVSQFIFPGNDKNSKRARRGFTLASARGKISNLKNEELKENAASQLELLEQVMFEEWFTDMIKDIKEIRRGNAHPPLDSYEDMRALVNEEFQDDQDACDDMLRVLEQLKIMYDRIQKPFGE